MPWQACAYCGGRLRCRSGCQCPDCEDKAPSSRAQGKKTPGDHRHEYRFSEEHSYEAVEGGKRYQYTVKKFECLAPRPCNAPYHHDTTRKRI
jgi:hypothetical protein